MKTLLTLMIFCATAQAEPKIVYQNKCPDITPATPSWDCLNFTQAAQRPEIKEQINKACKGIKCPTIYSVDPINKRGEYYYGAWKRNGKVYVAIDPSCPDSTKKLRKFLLGRL